MQRAEPFATQFLIVVLVGLVLLVGAFLLPYATPIAWACVLAAVFYPVYSLLLKSMPARPSLVAALMTVVVLALAVVPALLLTGVVAHETIGAYRVAADYIVEHKVQFFDDLSHHWIVAPVWNWVHDHFSDSDLDPTSLGLSGLRWLSEFAAANAAQVARNVLGFVIGLGVLTFTLFFAFRDGAAMVAYFEESLPMDSGDRRRLFSRLQTTLLAVVQGLAATALLQAVLLGAAYWALSVPYALLLAVVSFALAFVPVGGSAILWLPVAIGLYIGGAWVRGTILLAWGGGVVSLIDNFVRPLVIGGQAELPTPLLFFGILGGLQIYGFVGVFAGPATVAAFLSVVSIYRERLLELHGPAQPPP
ncbi:MAG TPA: AI-2E family transporter [Candidatus Binatia bacterium]|jgi:predicted PurR-regulated permease PerM